MLFDLNNWLISGTDIFVIASFDLSSNDKRSDIISITLSF